MATRTIKQNSWDNWSGFIDGKFHKEFGLDGTAAIEWVGEGVHPSLPTIEPQQDHESTLAHGYRVLVFVLTSNVTATLSDLELEHADYAAGYALRGKDILPTAATNLSDVRHRIFNTLKFRKDNPVEVLDVAVSNVYKDGIAGNPSAPVQLEPKPKNNPPAVERKVVPVVDFAF